MHDPAAASTTGEAATRGTSRDAPRLRSSWDAFVRTLLRRDIFISYRWTHKPYALALAEQLKRRGLSCFVDEEDVTGGDDIPRSIRRALRGSTMLVLVATDDIADSHWVPGEVAEFAKTRRKIVPVNVEGCLDRLPLEAAPWNALKNRGRVEEQTAAVRQGQPSPNIAEKIDQAFTFTRQATVAARTLWGAGIVLTALAMGLAASGYRAYAAARETERQTQKRIEAVQERTAAVGQRDRALKDREHALRESEAANDREKSALQREKRANDRREKALKDAREALEREKNALVRVQRADLLKRLREDELLPHHPTELGRRAVLLPLLRAAGDRFPEQAAEIRRRLSRIPPMEARRDLLPADPSRRAIAFDPSGRLLAVAYSDRIELRDARTFGPMRTIDLRRLPGRAPAQLIWMRPDPFRARILFEVQYAHFADRERAEEVSGGSGTEPFRFEGDEIQGSEREMFAVAGREVGLPPRSLGRSQKLDWRIGHDSEGEEHGPSWYEETAGPVSRKSLLQPPPAPSALWQMLRLPPRSKVTTLALDPATGAGIYKVEQFGVEIIDSAGSFLIYPVFFDGKRVVRLGAEVAYASNAPYIFYVDQTEPHDGLTSVMPQYGPTALESEAGAALLRDHLLRFSPKGSAPARKQIVKTAVRIGAPENISRIAFADRGGGSRLLVERLNGSIDVYDLARSTEVPQHRFLATEVVRGRAVSPEGEYVLQLRSDGSLEAWRLDAFGRDGWAWVDSKRTAAVHALVGELVGQGVFGAGNVEHGGAAEAGEKAARLGVEGDELGRGDLVAPGDLAGHQLRVGANLHLVGPAQERLGQTAQQGFVLGDVVGGHPDALADHRERLVFPVPVQRDPDPRRAGIAPRPAVGVNDELTHGLGHAWG